MLQNSDASLPVFQWQVDIVFQSFYALFKRVDLGFQGRAQFVCAELV
jgi:hypothetical protein